ncbi:MAG: hypothetical protein LPK02_04750 [Rhodobacterales bacterium]|nr:hypothetical protein [Rhodobacterales bacterium]
MARATAIADRDAKPRRVHDHGSGAGFLPGRALVDWRMAGPPHPFFRIIGDASATLISVKQGFFAIPAPAAASFASAIRPTKNAPADVCEGVLFLQGRML